MSWLRVALTVPPALAFVLFARRDLLLHLRARRVPRLEDLLHLGLGLSELALLYGAIAGAPQWLVGGAVGTAILGALDEYGFHHDLPPAEADAHAKGHLALFLLLTAALLATTLEAALDAHR